MQVSPIPPVAAIAAGAGSVIGLRQQSGAHQPGTQVSSRASVASATPHPAPSARVPSTISRGSSRPRTAATSSDEEAELAAVYSTTVGGKTYSVDVEQNSGEYTASVANLPGATSSGSSVEAAENNLSAVIDTLA